MFRLVPYNESMITNDSALPEELNTTYHNSNSTSALFWPDEKDNLWLNMTIFDEKSFHKDYRVHN